MSGQVSLGSAGEYQADERAGADGRDQLWGKLCLALVGRAMLSKSLVQLSADG